VLIIKPTDALISQIYFWNRTVRVLDSSSVHHQEFSTVHTAIPLCIVVCTVGHPDGGQRNCPKHVEFYAKNKFEELVHLVGFIIRIYHDARSPERQIRLFKYYAFDSFQRKLHMNNAYNQKTHCICITKPDM
jgi:hypothetical protein